MKIKQVHVQNYRSIVDSTPVGIEDGVTVLVGKNEQGKTTFLKGLASFNPSAQYTGQDLPNHLRPNLESQPAKAIPIVTINFSVEPKDNDKLGQLIGKSQIVPEIKATKYFDGSYAFFVVKDDHTATPLKFSPPDFSAALSVILGEIQKLKEKMSSHAQRLPEFAKNSERMEQLFSEFANLRPVDVAKLPDFLLTHLTALRGLPGGDDGVQNDIAASQPAFEAQIAAIQNGLKQEPVALLMNILPLFVFHSAVADQIPNEVKITDFVNNPEGFSRGMANRAAGLPIQKLQDLANKEERSEIAVYEDYYKGTISGGLSEFWTQETYEVHFVISKDRMSVFISDTTYSLRIPPSDRSDGFRWYLSFYCKLLNDGATAREKCILLDNPGMELHLDGQRDIKRFLEEKMALDSQIIYVTHSPAMIDPFNLTQIRKVELLPKNQGTKVSASFVKSDGDLDLLEPVRLAIGASLVGSLLFHQFNILIEGAADKPILDAALRMVGHPETNKVLVNGSVSETKEMFLPRFYQRSKLPFVILLDGDASGRKIKSALEGYDIKDEVVLLSDIFGADRERAIEDVLSAEFYHRAVVRSYPDRDMTLPAENNKMRGKSYEEIFRAAFGIGFSKKRVADTVGRMIEKNETDEETRANLEKIVGALYEKLGVPKV